MATLLLLIAGFAAGCHNNGVTNTITVTVNPATTTVALQGTAQFSASLTNATDTTVTWQVNKVTGGTSTCGTISANGLYTAPSVLPSSSACGTITITAISTENTTATGSATVTLTSGITISISPTGQLAMGTGETLNFVATVSGVGTNFVNTVNWLVNGVQGGSSTSGSGTITATTPGDGVTPAVYMAPNTISSSSTIVIEAQSVADTTQNVSVTLTLVSATPPTLDMTNPVVPTSIPQGALFQDLYLTGTNFLSTTIVTFAGQPVADVSRVSSTVLRARIPSNQLNAAGSFAVSAAAQTGNSAGGAVVTVDPVRPAALTVLPSNFVQQPTNSNGASTIEVDGGYYTPSSSLKFNGQPKVTTQSGQAISSITRSSGTVTATLVAVLTVPGGNGAGSVTVSGVSDPTFDGTFLVLAGSGTTTLRWAQAGANATSSGGTVLVTADPRRISASIGGIANDLTMAGLFQVSVSTPNASPPRTAADVTVRPTATPVVSNTITAQLSAPVAVAYDEVLGIPVVANQGTTPGFLALLDPAFTTVTKTINVGTSPTGVAVDSLHHVALVVDNGSQDVQAVDLVGQATLGSAVSIPSGQGPPFAVGVDNVHQIALVVGQNASSATLLDTSGVSPTSGPVIVGTVAVTTGSKPQVAVVPDLGWAIVTPGGTGSITVVDLVRSVATKQSVVVFTALLSPTAQGISLNSETNALLLSDPSTSNAGVFRLTDQSLGPVNLGVGNTGTAINSLTNLGVVVNPSLQKVFVVDLSTSTELSSIALNNQIQSLLAVAFPAGPNKALVTDSLGNSITVIDFGPIRASSGSPQILQVNCQASPPAVTTGCPMLIVSGTAASPVPLTVTGAGFAPNSQIRLEEMGSPAVTTTFVNPQLLTATIPVSLLNGGPRRIIVDVENPATGALSNVKNIYVLQAVSVGTAPAGVAVDPQRDLAVVANTADNTISVVDINPSSSTFGLVTSSVTVGAAPVSVGILTRDGRAVVADSGDATASVVDLTASPPSQVFRVSLGAQPAGVGVDQGLGTALVTSSGSDTVSTFDMTATSAPQPSALSTNPMPVAGAVAPDLELAAVAAETGSTVQILNVATAVPVLVNVVSGVTQPVAVDYDPVNQVFLVLERGANSVVTIDPATLATTSVRTGVDPSSFAYNYQTSTLLTLNNASNTLSVVDLMHFNVVDVLPLSGGSQYALAIHPRLGLVVVSDSVNNRVLLMPMPR
jgi:DNA-binding beta-propeller fold protein YncE